MVAAKDEDVRNVERQRALAREGITTNASLTAAEAAAAVSAARVASAQAAIATAHARVRVAEEAIENTNVRAPFDGVVIKKRAEVGETVSPFGVAGQASREGGAIATIADLGELEVQTEVSENSVAKLAGAMPAEVRLQAYQDKAYRGRLRQIFPSADRAKAIVEVRVSILDADRPRETGDDGERDVSGAARRYGGRRHVTRPPLLCAPTILVPKRAVVTQNGQAAVWVVRESTADAPSRDARARPARPGRSRQRRSAGRDGDSRAAAGTGQSRAGAHQREVTWRSSSYRTSRRPIGATPKNSACSIASRFPWRKASFSR